jgi:DNA segregation ATPase FtsK/SpoIIIE-like protein
MELASTPAVTDAKTAAKAFADCVKKIRERGRKARRQEVKEMIRQAEKAGDHEALERAKEEFNQLLKG